MRFTSLLHKQVEYSSLVWQESQAVANVRFAIRRTSLQQRIELMKKMKTLTLRQDFLSSGEDADQVQAAMNDLLVHRLYLEWGLADIQGLSIDGQKVNAEVLIERGPESLTNEIVAAIKAELHLSEDERKNF